MVALASGSATPVPMANKMVRRLAWTAAAAFAPTVPVALMAKLTKGKRTLTVVVLAQLVPRHAMMASRMAMRLKWTAEAAAPTRAPHVMMVCSMVKRPGWIAVALTALRVMMRSPVVEQPPAVLMVSATETNKVWTVVAAAPGWYLYAQPVVTSLRMVMRPVWTVVAAAPASASLVLTTSRMVMSRVSIVVVHACRVARLNACQRLAGAAVAPTPSA